MTDELARWAAGLAPGLRARAEAEAVATLRDALVAAALGERNAAPAPAPRPRSRLAGADDGGELLWAYCVLSASGPTPSGVTGVAADAAVERIEAAGLAALVSKVPAAEFGEEPLRENLNDLAWLERTARAHAVVLDQALATATIVPLRLCTLYETEDTVRQMLARERGAFAHALDYLSGREEWGVKLLIDPDLLAREAKAGSAEAASLEQNAETHGGGTGGAYMLGRRVEREVREAAARLAAQLAEEVDTRLADVALRAVRQPPQNRDLSRHEGEMILNAAYLVEAEAVAELRDRASALEAEHAALGARVQLTGPWPPYNFVPGGGTATIA